MHLYVGGDNWYQWYCLDLILDWIGAFVNQSVLSNVSQKFQLNKTSFDN